MNLSAKKHRKLILIGLAIILIVGGGSMTGCMQKKAIDVDPYVNRVPDDVLYQPVNPQSSQQSGTQSRTGEFETEEISDQTMANYNADNMPGGSGFAGDPSAGLTPEMKAFMDEMVYFDYDSSQLSPAALEILNNKIKWLKENPTVSVVIEGYTDSRGTIAYNLALGERRAESVKTYLVNSGIPAIRIATISYGEENPVDPNENEEAWAKNRRAHFVIKK